MSGLIELEIGALVGRFRVMREIGRGGHGVVYGACDTLLGREVALKTLSIENLTAAQVVTAEKEAYLLSRVDSPHVSAIYDLVHHQDAAVLVMELVEGPTLEARIDEGQLPWQEVATIGVELSRGLHALHAAGIVHRDIKPANLRLSRAGLLKILDLGVACWIPDVNEATRRDNTGPVIVGTIPYMAPEQLCGCRGDVRSDIYSSGAVLYEMATGRRVFDARPAGWLRTFLHPEARPRTLVPAMPSWMERAILRAVHPDPEQRFQSAGDLLTVLSSKGTPGERVRARLRAILSPVPPPGPTSSTAADSVTLSVSWQPPGMDLGAWR